MISNNFIKRLIKRRLNEFRKLGKTGRVTIDFSPFLNVRLDATLKTELIFCICTANSSAIAGLRVQKYLEGKNVDDYGKRAFSDILKMNGVRFHSKKASYIFNALRKFHIIEQSLQMNTLRARELLVREIKGLGYKEASHFLRNIGKRDIAILDRHILRWLSDKGMVGKITSLSRKRYLEIEKLLREIADRSKVTLAELDLWIWYEKTGMVLK